MADDAPVFYFDLISPYSFLAAHRLDQVLPAPAVWRPVWITPILLASGREWLPSTEKRQVRRDEVERRAAEYGMPPWTWPERFVDADDEGVMAISSLALMRLATAAARAGVGEDFARRAYALIFHEGHDTTVVGDEVIAAAVAAGLDEKEARAAPTQPEIKDALRVATEAAVSRGVIGLPTVAVSDELFWGDDQLDEAGAVARALA